MERESSDEEEDHQSLVHQNDTKPPTHSCSFNVDDLRPRIASRLSLCRFSANKRYLLLTCLPLLLVVVFFSTDIRTLFPAGEAWSLKVDTAASRMRESELQALHLLKQQQSSLAALWIRVLDNYNPGSIQQNSTVASPDNSTSNRPNSASPLSAQGFNSSSPSPLLFGHLRAALRRQISLNKEIQKVLLSSHGARNSSDFDLSGDNGDPTSSSHGLDDCQKVDQKLSERRTIEWKPKSSKYLLAICVSGQMSNHLICLEKHMFFAALLDRVLVIPSSRIDYQYSRVLDLHHINQCLGRKVLITFEEFSELRKKRVHIDKLLCYISLPSPCYMDEEHVKKLKSVGISMGRLQPVWNEDIKKPSKRTVKDVKEHFSSDDDVIAIGDVFYADVEQDWVMQPGGPLAHKCRALIEPSHLIMLTAQRFVQTFLGKNFVALHFRRHGFLKFCNAKNPSCFFSIPQAADCITQIAARANTPIIYLSTDAAESETGLLQSLIMVNGKTVPLVKRPARNSAEKWDALLYRHGLEQDPQVEAMLDKTICAMSGVFIGSPGSTFTEDILRLRKDWGTASLCDTYVCQGDQPDFIAENE